jgi:hypothetical protein
MSLSVNFWCYVDGGRFVCSIRLRVADWRLHPLIHTLLKFKLAQDIDLCLGGEKESPH